MRMEKVNAAIKKEISSILQFGDIKDPRIKFITIMSVEVSRDLQHARVLFSTLSDDPNDVKNATEGLLSCRGYIRKLISQRVEMRYTPELNFYYDKGVQYMVQVDKALAEIKNLTSPEEGKADE
jgi:ribosome-binding factor A